MFTVIDKSIVMRFDFSKPDAFLIEPVTNTLESIFYFEPEIFLCLVTISSFLFAVYAYFSADSLYKKLSAVDEFLIFLMYVVLIAGLMFYHKSFFMYNAELFGFFFSFKLVVSAGTMHIKAFLSAVTILVFSFIKFSNLEFRPYSRVLPEYFLFSPETLLIIMFNFVFSIFLVSATDFFVAILFLQGLTITNYFLFVGASSKSSIANTLKYYFFSSWVLVLLLLSAFLLYSVVGSLNFFIVSNTISELFSENYVLTESYIYLYFQRFLIVVGSFFFFFSLFFKLGLSPLHPVTIDVCQTMPKPFLYTTMVVNKFTIFVLLSKIALTIFVDLFLYVRPLFFITGVISIFYGTLQLLYTNKIKLFFAYAMLQSTGFLILILSFCFANPDDYGTTLSILTWISQYFIISFLSWGVFFFIWISCNGMLAYTWKVRKGLNYVSDFSAMGVFFKLYNPFYRVALTISLLNLIGFPPFVIFFIKFSLLLKLVSSYSIIFGLFLLFLFVLLTARVFEIFRLFWLFYYDASTKMFQEFLRSDSEYIFYQQYAQYIKEAKRLAEAEKKPFYNFYVIEFEEIPQPSVFQYVNDFYTSAVCFLTGCIFVFHYALEDITPDLHEFIFIYIAV